MRSKKTIATVALILFLPIDALLAVDNTWRWQSLFHRYDFVAVGTFQGQDDKSLANVDSKKFNVVVFRPEKILKGEPINSASIMISKKQNSLTLISKRLVSPT